MISVIIKKACQDEQQNQTKIATNINYIQNFMSIFFKKKPTNKLKILLNKSETKQNNLYFTRKDMGPLNEKAR